MQHRHILIYTTIEDNPHRFSNVSYRRCLIDQISHCFNAERRTLRFTWSNTTFDDICPTENQLLHHFTRHHITSLERSDQSFEEVQQRILTNKNCLIRKFSANKTNEFHKMLRISVGNINTDIIQCRNSRHNLSTRQNRSVSRSISKPLILPSVSYTHLTLPTILRV